MSILTNCYEYLLSVTEKIVLRCADGVTTEKYFQLKDQVLSKCPLQTENSHISCFSSEKDNQRSSVLRSSVANSSSSKLKREKTRQSVGKSKGKENRKQDSLEKARVQSYTSKVTSKLAESMRMDTTEYCVLLHLTAIIKNAQACPSMLKTITFLPNTFNEQINETLRTIAQSLSSVYEQLTKQPSASSSKTSASKLQQPGKPNLKELLNDNKWLLDKLEVLVEQNTALRRIVGSNQH